MKNKNTFLSVGIVALLSTFPTSSFADCSGRCAGWEAVGEYNGTSSNLTQTIPEAQKFQNAISQYSNTWVTDFGYQNNAAWEKDFKDDAIGGTDYIYADDVDLMLFSGHGNQNGFYFGVNQTDLVAHYNESTLGNKDLEWIIIDACNILQDNSGKWNRWGWPVFEGLHYIFSYSSTTYDKDSRGKDFIKYAMGYNWKVRDAWIKSTIISENGTTAAYMRADNGSSNTYDDHLWGFGSVSSDPVNPTVLSYLSWGT